MAHGGAIRHQARRLRRPIDAAVLPLDSSTLSRVSDGQAFGLGEKDPESPSADY